MKVRLTRDGKRPARTALRPGAWSVALLCALPASPVPAVPALAADVQGAACDWKRRDEALHTGGCARPLAVPVLQRAQDALAGPLDAEREPLAFDVITLAAADPDAAAPARALTKELPAAAVEAAAAPAAGTGLAQADGPRLQPFLGNTPVEGWRRADSDTRQDAAPLLATSVAATTAWEEAEAAERAAPGTFTSLQLMTLQQEALAQQLRWAVAARDQRIGMVRFEALDRVLEAFAGAELRQKAAAAQAAPADAAAWNDLSVALLSDRLLALLERGRPAETIALYETLRASGAVLQPYALVAVADALAQQRRSVDAVALYETALLDEGSGRRMPVEAYFGLIYAYLDTGRFEEAESLLAKLEADTPPLLRLPAVAGRANPEYSSVKGMRGFLLMYTGRVEEARQHFDALIEEAPFNAGYAQGAAEAELLRGHPRAALAQLEALSANHPYDRNIRADYAQTLLTLNEFAAARRIGESLAADYPDSTFQRKFERQQRAATGAFLEVAAGLDTGGGNALADRSWSLDTRLSSGLLGDEWRVFYDQILGRGETGDERARWARGGLGLGWQRGGWLAEGKVQQANQGPYRSSAAALVSYRADDHWLLSATADGNSKDVPWKARAAGIGARDAGVSAAYMVDDGRRFDASWQQVRFSDTNRRNAASASWRERWVSGPRFQLESLLGGYASRNSRQDTPYFSPARDASVQLSLRGQWLSWKSDDRQFFQILEIGGGRYHQVDFGSKPMWGLRYEHQWNLGPKLQLRYGLSLSRHPYDGVSERQRGIFVSLLVPL
ncbi:MAG: poly-beta-1,6 N-acetyl-D-glucosamine export porin PgaA [Polaromonas sp.]|uniref:poly-beta-1,6 N-acetyl-D-glucosamine export porin PgaA n=1 Tax=Polaromonas sp. TaxID=1869339 RepID=UPI002487CF30|nr:poly-beta-1,6 N-acetyl-D-glucosamine export porin PgaA [Polaromonas sp.]MDI1268769.1 poly-beta-1,6 N-acetyl-D-glucosamine export porin PgaA [Polaromonas sp.]